MVKNNSSLDLGTIMPLLKSFLPFAQERMGFNRPPSLEFLSDSENAELPLGKTAHYSPEDSKIVIFVDKRHPKDIMRSLSHELVHHNQNCNGKFSSDMEMGEGYAQKDGHLREMEKEAYLEGNLLLRDWEDNNKNHLQETIYYETFKGDTKMSINDIRNARMNNLLMEKFGYKIKEKAGHPGKTCNEAHPGQDHPEGDVNEDYDDKWGEDDKEELEEAVEAVDVEDVKAAVDTSVDTATPVATGAPVDTNAAAEAESDAEDAVAAAKNQVAAGMTETLLRKKIREVLRNSFNAKS